MSFEMLDSTLRVDEPACGTYSKGVQRVTVEIEFCADLFAGENVNFVFLFLLAQNQNSRRLTELSMYDSESIHESKRALFVLILTDA